jgi:MoaA/NifB/PqqE/SkfB family radical SAM enzyme
MSVALIAFHVTDRCQLDCQHCLRDPAQKPRDLEPGLIARVLDEAARLYRTPHVALTGGEPMLHPEFCAIVDAIAARGLTWHMVTNGRRFPWLLERFEERPERRASMTLVDLSLDGASEEVHDAIRGAGSYRDVMRAVSLCTAHAIPFLLQMSVHARNQHEVEPFGLLAANLGAARVSFVMTQATGTLHDEALYLAPAAWRAVQDRIARLAGALKLPVVTPEGFFHEQPFHVCEPWRSEQLHVDLAGRLNLCCQHSGLPSDERRGDVAGDLHAMSLAEAHARFLDLVHGAQRDRVAAIAAGPLDEWDHFPCNWCLKHFGKPHWAGEGAAGPAASRERWTGAWAEEHQVAAKSIRRHLAVVD